MRGQPIFPRPYMGLPPGYPHNPDDNDLKSPNYHARNLATVRPPASHSRLTKSPDNAFNRYNNHPRTKMVFPSHQAVLMPASALFTPSNQYYAMMNRRNHELCENEDHRRVQLDNRLPASALFRTNSYTAAFDYVTHNPYDTFAPENYPMERSHDKTEVRKSQEKTAALGTISAYVNAGPTVGHLRTDNPRKESWKKIVH